MIYRVLVGIVGFFFKLLFRIEVIGKENIPDYPVIVCANHRHMFDPVYISIIYPRQIYWMGKKELFENKLLGNILESLGAFPVDRGSGLGALRKSMNLIKEEKTLGVFPEGTRVKEVNYENAHPGVALISIKNKMPFLPIYIDTNYKLFSKVRIIIGQAKEFEDAYERNLRSEDYQEYGKEVLYTIYNLKDQGA